MPSLSHAAVAAEKEPRTANHPPGFTKPEPDEVIRLWPGDAPNLVAGGNPEEFVNERYRHVSVPQLFVYLPDKRSQWHVADHLCRRRLRPPGDVPARGKRRPAVERAGNRRVRPQVSDPLWQQRCRGRCLGRRPAGRPDRASRAGQWGLDPHRVGVQGYSAGANLCLNLAGKFDAGHPESADPVERFSCRPDFCVLMCVWPNNRTPDQYPLGKDAPPTFFAHAQDDKIAPLAFATDIDAKLKGLGVPEQLFVVNSGGHGAFHYGMVEGPGANWPERLLPWLQQLGMYRDPR